MQSKTGSGNFTFQSLVVKLSRFQASEPFISFLLPTHNKSNGNDTIVFSNNSKHGLCHEKVSIPKYFPSGFIEGIVPFNAWVSLLELEPLFLIWSFFLFTLEHSYCLLKLISSILIALEEIKACTCR